MLNKPRVHVLVRKVSVYKSSTLRYDPERAVGQTLARSRQLPRRTCANELMSSSEWKSTIELDNYSDNLPCVNSHAYIHTQLQH